MADQQIDDLVQKISPGGQLVCTWKLSGGLSTEMIGLEIDPADGPTRRYILRCFTHDDRRSAEREYRLLGILSQFRLSTPVPVCLDGDSNTKSWRGLVIEFIEGKMELAPVDIDRYARQMAEHLARIHCVDWSQFDLSFLPQPEREIAGVFARHPAIHWLDEERIIRLVETAWPVPQLNQNSLLHGDFWPGNILWSDDGNLCGVVDWEDAQTGDPIIDLALSRLDLTWIFSAQAAEIFTDIYLEKTGFDATALPIWDLVAVLRLSRILGPNLQDWARFFHEYGRFDMTAYTIEHQLEWFTTQAIRKLGERKIG